MISPQSLELYIHQQAKLPKTGRHMIACHDENSIVVYQAFNRKIAHYAIENQKFGGDNYNLGRMTWIKPGFMWMMYRSGWAQKENQECILAIRIKMGGFLEILKNATHSSFQPDIYANKEEWQTSLNKYSVRLQWDPDHNQKGIKLERKAIQLGMKDNILNQFNNEWILKIEDITDFVDIQRNNAFNNLQKLEVPIEKVLDMKNELLKNRLGISTIE